MPLTLTYLEREPREKTTTRPLIVLLHGRAAYAKTIFTIEGLIDPRFHVIALQAPFVCDKGGFEWFKPNEEGRSDEITEASRFQESESILTKEIHTARAERDLEKSPLVLLGFSQGAAMSFLLSLRGTLPVTAAVPMSGFLPQPVKTWESLATSTKFLITHGSEDEVLPPSTSINAKDHLISRGISAEYYQYRGRHKMSLSCLHYVNDWLKQHVLF
jgi:phospholipase/carboxylesterase